MGQPGPLLGLYRQRAPLLPDSKWLPERPKAAAEVKLGVEDPFGSVASLGIVGNILDLDVANMEKAHFRAGDDRKANMIDQHVARLESRAEPNRVRSWQRRRRDSAPRRRLSAPGLPCERGTNGHG